MPELFRKSGYEDLQLDAYKRDSRTLELRRYLGIPGPDENNTILTDHYFFFSRSIGTVSDSLSEEEFLKSSRVFLRLQAEKLSLEQLADIDHPFHPGSILLRRAQELLEPVPCNLDSLSAIAQLYGAELTDAIKAEFVRLERLEMRRKNRICTFLNKQLRELISRKYKFCFWTENVQLLNIIRRVFF